MAPSRKFIDGKLAAEWEHHLPGRCSAPHRCDAEQQHFVVLLGAEWIRFIASRQWVSAPPSSDPPSGRRRDRHGEPARGRRFGGLEVRIDRPWYERQAHGPAES